MDALSNANIFSILVGACVAIITSVTTLYISRVQARNERERLILEAKRAEDDKAMVGSSAAAQLIGGATSVVTMYQTLADKYAGDIGSMQLELADCRGTKEQNAILRVHMMDLIDMIRSTMGDRQCPIGNEACATANASLMEYADRLEKRHFPKVIEGEFQQ